MIKEVEYYQSTINHLKTIIEDYKNDLNRVEEFYTKALIQSQISHLEAEIKNYEFKIEKEIGNEY